MGQSVLYTKPRTLHSIPTLVMLLELLSLLVLRSLEKVFSRSEASSQTQSVFSLKDPLYARSSAVRLKAVNPLYAVKYDSPLTVQEERSVLRSEDLFFVLGKGHIGRA